MSIHSPFCPENTRHYCFCTRYLLLKRPSQEPTGHYLHYRCLQPHDRISHPETPPPLTQPLLVPHPNGNPKQSFFASIVLRVVRRIVTFIQRTRPTFSQKNLTSQNSYSLGIRYISYREYLANMCNFHLSKILIPISWCSTQIQLATSFLIAHHALTLALPHSDM